MLNVFLNYLDRASTYVFSSRDKSGPIDLIQHVLDKFRSELALHALDLRGLDLQREVVRLAVLDVAHQHIMSD
jgi:hypothetical protein